ncbi:MAG: hypothetical protein OXK21_06270, partial [Chloroflexota bacterium]|nr:hypothetical protein [Chloroflexota bacterium]
AQGEASGVFPQQGRAVRAAPRPPGKGERPGPQRGDEVREAMLAAGFEELETQQTEDWLALAFRRGSVRPGG